MKLLRAFVLSAALIVPVYASQAPAPKPVEYVTGACTGKGFTVLHGVLDEKSLTFDYFMQDPQTVVKDKDPLIYDITKKETKKDEFTLDGVLRTKDPELNVEIHGVLRKGRFAALVLSHGNLAMVLYGYVGDTDKMVVTALDQFAFCKGLHAVDQNEIPNILNEYVDNGSVKAPAQDN